MWTMSRTGPDRTGTENRGFQELPGTRTPCQPWRGAGKTGCTYAREPSLGQTLSPRGLHWSRATHGFGMARAGAHAFGA